MELTQKFSIDITEEQEIVAWILSEKCRLIYNFALSHREAIYKETGVPPTYTMQQNDLPELKIKYPEYEWVHSKVLQMVLHHLHDDYSSFLSKIYNGDETARPPGYKGKDYFTTMTWNQSGFKIEDGYIILSHYYNDGKKNYVELKIKIPDNLMKNTDIDLHVMYGFEKIKQITMFRDDPFRKKKGQFYLSVTYDYPAFPPKDNGLYQAIDLGIGKTVCAVNMEAKFFEIKNPRADLYWNPIIDEIQARRDHCKKVKVEEKLIDKYGNVVKDKDNNSLSTKVISVDQLKPTTVENNDKEKTIKITKPSKRWIRLNDAKKKCHKKCSKQIENWQHKWTDKMPRNTKANTIIVGELSVKKMAQSGVKIKVATQLKLSKDESNKKGDKDSNTKIIKVKSHKLNRSVQNQGYLSKFVGFLTYKTEKIGKRVIKISEVNTTKRCYACGKLHDMTLSDRTMKCDCGNIIDRDRNSAINIMLDFLLKYNLSDGLRRFINSLNREGLLVPIWIKI